MSQHLQQAVLKVRWLAHGEGLELPRYQTLHAAGLDLPAAIASDEPMVLKTGQRGLVPTGLSIALQEGFEAQIRPRSGLALRYGITVLNSPGTIDADYRGEIKIILINLGEQDFTVERGQRIAQLVIAPVTSVAVEIVTELDDTPRGKDGFGSTGEKG